MSSPRPPDHHLVFSHVVESFFLRVMKEKLTPSLTQKIKTVGIDLGKPLDPAYKLAVMEDALELVALELFSHLPRTEALIEVGHLQVSAFSDTMLGRATMPLFKLYGRNPERALTFMSRAMRQGNNYVETKHVTLAEGHYRLWFNDAGRLPEIFQGMLVAGNRFMGIEMDVRIAERTGLEAWYELRRQPSAPS